MLKLIYGMAELDTEQLLDIYGKNTRDANRLISYLREDFFWQDDAFYAVWVVDGKYKSAVRFERYRDGLLLHALQTVASERGKGYAYLLLSEVLNYLRSTDTKTVFSHVDKRNKASLTLHKKCGFTIISDCATYLDGTVTQYSNTLQICL